MDGVVKFLLIADLILLVSAQTFLDYNSLTEELKKQTDKTLKQANSIFGDGHHVALHSFPKDKKHFNVLLIVTTCKKTSADAYAHRNECVTRKPKTPIIDCLVCVMNNGEELVDCGTVKNVQEKKRDHIRQNCRNYLIGSGVLFQKSKDQNPIGCIGCV